MRSDNAMTPNNNINEGNHPSSGDCGAEQTVNKINPVKEKKHHLQGRYRRSVLSACVQVFSKIGVG